MSENYRAYKIEVKLTKTQKELLRKTQNVCRFVYNKMLEYNINSYKHHVEAGSKEKHHFVGAFEYGKMLNNVFIEEYGWHFIKEVPSKPVRKALMNCERAFKNFFETNKAFPKFKNAKSHVGVYFSKNSKTEFTYIKRNKAKIPVFGWVHLKEFGRINPSMQIASCVISEVAERFYISFLVKVGELPTARQKGKIIGIDVGLQNFATTSDGKTYQSPNRLIDLNKLRRKLKRRQRKISRKLRADVSLDNCTRENLRKSILNARKVHVKISRKLKAFHHEIITDLIKDDTKAFVLEKMSIKYLIKNKYLAKAIQNSGFYQFGELLTQRSEKVGISVHRVSRQFPSSKLCSSCGNLKNFLGLKVRTYNCEVCGLSIDRDLNASLNLRNQFS